MALIDLSEILVLKDRLEEAHKAADQAVELLRPLANPAKPSDPTSQDRWLLSMALTDRGVASLEAGRPAAAGPDLDLAEETADRIAEPGQESYDAQFQVAYICNRRGELLGLEPSRLAGAEQQYERAAQLLQELVATHKVIPHYREELAVTLAGRAAIRAGLGPSSLAEAQRDCEAAQVHLESLIEGQKRKRIRINPHYLSLLSRTHSTASRIHLARGDAAKAQDGLVKAAEIMKQATDIDPARARDRVFLDGINAQLHQVRVPLH